MRISCVILQRRVPRRSAVLGEAVAVGADVPLVLGVLPITLCWVSMKDLASHLVGRFEDSLRLAEYKTYRGDVPYEG